MRLFARKGFTLIELLIVIVVIGVIAAMMMFSSSEAVTTAEATKIITDLKQLQKAVLAWRLDNYDRLIWDTTTSKNGYKIDGTEEIHTYLHNHPDELQRYFSSNFELNYGRLHKGNGQTYDSFYATVGGFSVYMGESNTRCYVLYKISDDDKKQDKSRLREKLLGRAESAGLLSYNYSRSKGNKAYPYDGGNHVFMEVFRLKDDQEMRR